MSTTYTHPHLRKHVLYDADGLEFSARRTYVDGKPRWEATPAHGGKDNRVLRRKDFLDLVDVTAKSHIKEKKS